MFFEICPLFNKIHSLEVIIHYSPRNACHTVLYATMAIVRSLSRSFLTLCGVWAIQVISNVKHIPLHAPHLFTTLEVFGPCMPKCNIVTQGNRKLQIIAYPLDTSHGLLRLFVNLLRKSLVYHQKHLEFIHLKFFRKVCELNKRIRSAFVAAIELDLLRTTASQREATDWDHVLLPLPRGRKRIRNSLPFSFAHLGPIADSV